MSCYPLDYLCPDDEMKEELEPANYQLSFDGLEFTPISGRKRTVLRYIYKAFLKTGVSGLDFFSFLFFMSTAYSYPHLALWDEEVFGICRVRNRFIPWTMRETRCVSKWTTELIEFVLGKDVSLHLTKLFCLFYGCHEMIREKKKGEVMGFREGICEIGC